MEIIDPHVHFWDPYTTPRTVSPLLKLNCWPGLQDLVAKVATPAGAAEFVGKRDYIVAPYLPEQHRFCELEHTLRGVVHVEAGWHDHSPLGAAGETRWLDSLNPPPLGIAGRVDLRADDLPQLLAAHRAASSRFVGVRDMLAHSPLPGVMNWHEDSRAVLRDDFRRGFDLLAKENLTFEAWVYDHQLPDLCELVERHPSTRVMLDHIASPVGVGGPYQGRGLTRDERRSIRQRWLDNLRRLAESRQVHVKLSGLAMPILGWGFHERPVAPEVSEVVDKLGPLISSALGIFGHERCVFASNFPMDIVSMPLDTLYEAYFRLTASLGEDTQQRLFRDNAVAFYGL